MELFPPRLVPRIVFTRSWIEAVQGRWELDGRVVEVWEETDTGTVVASGSDGRRICPLEVVSRGRRLLARGVAPPAPRS